MKVQVSLLALMLSVWASANEAPHYYWGHATSTKVDGSVSKTLVLGKRVHDVATNKIVDAQIYESPNETGTEYTYEFDFATKKMTSKVGEKLVGEGTFKCNGTLEKHTKCEYDYTETGAYRGKGKDNMKVPHAFYREESVLTYEGKKDPVKYDVTFYEVDEKFYQSLRSKLIAK